MLLKNINKEQLSYISGGKLSRGTKKCLLGLGSETVKDAIKGGALGNAAPAWGTVAGAIGGANIGLVAGVFKCYGDLDE